MGKRSITLLATALLIVIISLFARKIDEPNKETLSKDALYTFQANGFVMIRSTNRIERNNEQAFIAEKLFSQPQALATYPLTQTIGKPLADSNGQHIAPDGINNVAPRADFVHSKGAVKDFYKLTYNPALNAKPSTVVCIPRSKIEAATTLAPNFRYKFTTKAENTVYGTIPYTCYVTPDNDEIRMLFESLPGTTDDKNIRVIGQ